MAQFSKDVGNNILYDSTNPIKTPKTKIVFGEDGTNQDVTNTNPLPVVASGGILPVSGYDAITYTNTSSTVDTYYYKTGGASGTIVATLTITYTDSSKSTLVSAVRT